MKLAKRNIFISKLCEALKPKVLLKIVHLSDFLIEFNPSINCTLHVF